MSKRFTPVHFLVALITMPDAAWANTSASFDCVTLAAHQRIIKGEPDFLLEGGLKKKITFEDGWVSDSIRVGSDEYDYKGAESHPAASNDYVKEQLSSARTTIPDFLERRDFVQLAREEGSSRTVYFREILFFDKNLLDGSAQDGQVFTFRIAGSQGVGTSLRTALQCTRVQAE